MYLEITIDILPILYSLTHIYIQSLFSEGLHI